MVEDSNRVRSVSFLFWDPLLCSRTLPLLPTSHLPCFLETLFGGDIRAMTRNISSGFGRGSENEHLQKGIWDFWGTLVFACFRRLNAAIFMSVGKCPAQNCGKNKSLRVQALQMSYTSIRGVSRGMGLTYFEARATPKKCKSHNRASTTVTN